MSAFNIGAAIKRKRKAQKMTQYRLGLACELSDKMIWEIEHGSRIGTLGALKQIANALGCPLWELVRETEEGK